ncbi:hypothetical protein OS493_013124 [Desmophyllum pertusum]|uniref:F-box domain-containing protein n=1 Tax=Desmophyllum pertusum TaxID=174260 RepID=A0A9W9YPY7_9CNID|nr:hypothetical protein OS493_013124 [Desmophyllum pertusum]
MELLDDLVLRHIISFLDPEDIVRLGRTSRRMYSLTPRVILTTEVWKGEDFHVSAAIVCPSELYFDGPVLCSSVKKLTMSVIWKDQGWGNKKGEIFMKLMRPDARCLPSPKSTLALSPPEREPIEIAEHRQLFGIAEHYRKRAQTVISDHPVVSKARSGDFYRFMRYVGCGGGHQLDVKDFRVVATVCRVIY